MIVVIDCFDSFVYNLARYLIRLGQPVCVHRCNEIQAADIARLSPRGILLSPGPCTPDEAGCSLDVVRTFHRQVPILGVCLGHQTIAQALGGQVVRAMEPVHGRASEIHHRGQGIFAGLPTPFMGGRYHSLAVSQKNLPAALQTTAWTADGTIMGLQAIDGPTFGVQFHPESVITENGYQLLANFVQACDPRAALTLPQWHTERLPQPQEAEPELTGPAWY